MNERLNTIHKTNEGYFVKVIEYQNYDKIVVEIQDEYKYKVRTGWGNLIKGKIKNPYHRSVYGVGYFGDGRYKSRINGSLTKEYKHWQSMLQRCYDKKLHDRDPSYVGCTVCEEWHNFQKFANWFEVNYYEIDGKKMCLDKDLLFKNNKQYSPQNCVFVPQEINLIFATHSRSRGKLSIGVVFDKTRGKFMSHLIKNKKFVNLGYFDDEEKAFLSYKKAKEEYIQDVAKLYKNRIPLHLYRALMTRKIDSDD